MQHKVIVALIRILPFRMTENIFTPISVCLAILSDINIFSFPLSGSASVSSIPVSLPTSPVSLSTLGAEAGLAGCPPGSPPRPPTPDLGIPMEMTAGQIMEAEISATLLDSPTASPLPTQEQVRDTGFWFFNLGISV